MKTYNIFLASSLGDGLEDDRMAIGNLVRKLNQQLARREVRIALFKCEHADDAYNGVGKQTEYNAEIGTSELFFALFNTHTGAYTIEELNLAEQMRQTQQQPRIVVGLRGTADEETDAVRKMRQRCIEHQTATFNYHTTDELLYEFTRQVLGALGLEEVATVRDGWLTMGNMRLCKTK